MESVAQGKACSKCGEWKSFDSFYVKTDSPLRYKSQCKECCKTNVSTRRAYKKKLPPAQVTEQGRICRKCNEWKTWDHYGKASDKKFGYNEQCKICSRLRYNEYIEQPGKREMARKRAKLASRNDTPERKRKRSRDRYKRVRANASPGINDAQWTMMCSYFGNKCLACGKETQLTMDHVIPLALGGVNHITNLQPLCGHCNTTKGAWTIADYRDSQTLKKFLLDIVCPAML